MEDATDGGFKRRKEEREIILRHNELPTEQRTGRGFVILKFLRFCGLFEGKPAAGYTTGENTCTVTQSLRGAMGD